MKEVPKASRSGPAQSPAQSPVPISHAQVFCLSPPSSVADVPYSHSIDGDSDADNNNLVEHDSGDDTIDGR